MAIVALFHGGFGWGAGDRFSKLVDDSSAQLVEVSRDGKAGSIAMPSTTKMLSHTRNVDAILGTETDTVGRIRKLPEEGYRFDIANSQRVIDDPVRIILACTRFL